jgi:ABC-type lipoprotein export system ATPase subunit
MDVPDEDRPILRFGIHEERFAEMLTDSLRALTLQYYGYETNIIEFVPSRHTPKNVLITAVKNRKNKNEQAREKIQMLKKRYGLKDYYLDKQLAIDYNTN